MKKGVFVRGRRFSAEGLLTIDGMISNTIVEGSMTHARFLHYLEFTVVFLPHLVASFHIYHVLMFLQDAVVFSVSRLP